MSSEEISRRRMLKRIGAGAAVAWSAPILTSIRTPAFAQYGACSPGSPCLSCGPDAGCPTELSPHCGGGTDCFQLDYCGCVTDVDGKNVCLNVQFGSGPCTSSSDCLDNEACVRICSNLCDPSGMHCIPHCGTGVASSRSGRSAARR
jgi:hypothetical protein